MSIMAVVNNVVATQRLGVGDRVRWAIGGCVGVELKGITMLLCYQRAGKLSEAVIHLSRVRGDEHKWERKEDEIGR